MIMNNLSLKVRSWLYKQTHFEFFSINRLYLPVLVYSLYQSILFRKLFWYAYVNPIIYNGGLNEHSKQALLKYFTGKNLIPSFFIKKGSSKKILEQLCLDSKLSFPLVVKPDCASRGKNIYKVYSMKELLETYNNSIDYLVQEVIDLPEEFAVFYVRYPDKERGYVTSLVQKEFMKFVGDGKKTLLELIYTHPRAWLYLKKMNKIFPKDEQARVLEKDEVIKASFVGSHNGGTIFYNKSSLITEKISHYFDSLTKKIPEFYYGRYDIKAKSLKDLENGDFKVLELNAAIGEPVHMYDPKTTIKQGYSILLSYWVTMKKIAIQNKKRGISLAKKPD